MFHKVQAGTQWMIPTSLEDGDTGMPSKLVDQLIHVLLPAVPLVEHCDDFPRIIQGVGHVELDSRPDVKDVGVAEGVKIRRGGVGELLVLQLLDHLINLLLRIAAARRLLV